MPIRVKDSTTKVRDSTRTKEDGEIKDRVPIKASDLIKELILIRAGEIKDKAPIKTKEVGEIKAPILIREDGATKDQTLIKAGETKVEIKDKDLEAIKGKDLEVIKGKDSEAIKAKALTKEDKADGEIKGKETIKDGAIREAREDKVLEGRVLEDRALAAMSIGKNILGSNPTKTGVLQDS
jgi:hypothetical protein